MTDLYTVVCMQMNRVGIDNRKEIRKAFGVAEAESSMNRGLSKISINQ